MRTAICDFAFIPVRNGMSHKNEMVNQILFGEIFEILIARGDWAKVRLLHDNYEGWIDENQISLINNDQDAAFEINEYVVCKTALKLFNHTTNEEIIIPSGAKLPKLAIETGEIEINNNKYSFSSEHFSLYSIDFDKRNYIIDIAKSMLNSPYLWGGRTSWGLDCSGFSQFLYSLLNINLPRDASQQVNIGNTLNFVSEAKPGDLAFFDNDEGEITHVGIIYEFGKIIHCSGKVRTDTLDHQGIYNKNLKRYTHKLRVVKSILD